MNIEEVLRYHQNKVNYYSARNKEFRNMSNWCKKGYYKAIYDNNVLKYRSRLKWHTQAIESIKERL